MRKGKNKEENREIPRGERIREREGKNEVNRRKQYRRKVGTEGTR
jgi:hypothetical protein